MEPRENEIKRKKEQISKVISVYTNSIIIFVDGNRIK